MCAYSGPRRIRVLKGKGRRRPAAPVSLQLGEPVRLDQIDEHVPRLFLQYGEIAGQQRHLGQSRRGVFAAQPMQGICDASS
jgi:hypothetical protein